MPHKFSWQVLRWLIISLSPQVSPPHKPTCGEVDVCEEYNVGGDEGYQLSNANLFLEVDVNNVLLSQRAVRAGMQQLETRAEAAEEPEMESEQEDVNYTVPNNQHIIPWRNSVGIDQVGRSSTDSQANKAWFSLGLTPKVCSSEAQTTCATSVLWKPHRP